MLIGETVMTNATHILLHTCSPKDFATKWLQYTCLCFMASYYRGPSDFLKEHLQLLLQELKCKNVVEEILYFKGLDGDE